MELKDKLIASFETFEQGLKKEHDGIQNIRLEGLETFKRLGLPTRKEEAWKYTSLKAILQQQFDVLPTVAPKVDAKIVEEFSLNNTDTYKVVFLNGAYSAELSNISEGIEVSLLSDALVNPKHLEVIAAHYNQVTDKQDSLTALNTAYAAEGAFIYVPKSRVVEKAIELIYLSTAEDNALLVQPRNLVVVEENAFVQVFERHQSISECNVFTNSVTEIIAEKRAVCDFYKLQNDLDTGVLIDNTFILQKQESRVSVHTFSFGGKLTRNNLNFYQEGERIDSTLKGITIIDGKQHVDHYTLVSHNQPNCESHQNYKGIYDDQSVGVFNGKIYVDKIAQKTDGFQQSNNVVLNDKAAIYAKPQLEIFADDVKCSHGCTIGQLDEEAIFYMRQRGIPQKEAKALIMYAFTDEVMESVKIPELKTKVASVIAKKLGVSMGFEE